MTLRARCILQYERNADMHDLARATQHTFCYTIAFTIRSGSNLLCDLLSRNGAGYPTEYFQSPFGVTNKHWYEALHVRPSGEVFQFNVRWPFL